MVDSDPRPERDSDESVRERTLVESARRRAAAVTASRASGGARVRTEPELPVFPGYTVVGEADRGGQGVVYEAMQESTGRAVAIKMLRGGAFAAESSRARLAREVQMLAQLDHEGVCPVIDFLSESDQLFVVMPFLGGENLSRRIGRAAASREGGASLEAAWETIVEGTGFGTGRTGVLALIEDIARSVHDVHEGGIVHRDLKPGNLMLREGRRPVVLDFGLAVELDDEDAARFTPDGEPVGTPAYMAPEQIDPARAGIDRRTDVYGLGVVLYELLTLRRAFRGTSLVEVCGDITHGRFRAPRTVEAAIAPDLEAVCLRAMAIDPAQRYSTTLALADDLARVSRGEATVARPLSVTARIWRALHRRRELSVAALVVIAALAFALGRGDGRGDPIEEVLSDDPRVVELLTFEPAGVRELEDWLGAARERYPLQASSDPRIEPLAPRAAILDDRPDFKLRVPPAASRESDNTYYTLRLFDGEAELRYLDVAQVGGGSSILTAPLDAEDRLVPGVVYAFTIELRESHFDPFAELAQATFRIVDPAQLRAGLSALDSSSGTSARLGRAAVMLSLDLAEEARAELALLPEELEPRERLRRELLFAYAAALVWDAPNVEAHSRQVLELVEEDRR